MPAAFLWQTPFLVSGFYALRRFYACGVSSFRFHGLKPVSMPAAFLWLTPFLVSGFYALRRFYG